MVDDDGHVASAICRDLVGLSRAFTQATTDVRWRHRQAPPINQHRVGGTACVGTPKQRHGGVGVGHREGPAANQHHHAADLPKFDTHTRKLNHQPNKRQHADDLRQPGRFLVGFGQSGT